MKADDADISWRRHLLLGLGAMLGVAVLVGATIGLIALGGARLVGLGGEERVAVDTQPSLHIPERTPSADGEDDDQGLTLEDLGGGTAREERQSPSGDEGLERREQRERRSPRSVISLSVSPLEVARMERIYLTGTYPGGEGASLQVQRFEGGWTDFPVSTSVSGGTFSTYVMTGQAGPNRFRVVDTARGKRSNPVRVQVR